MSTVVKVANHPRVGVWPVGIPDDADALDDRVDLDGVDTADPVAQRVVDVIAGPRADDELILEGRAAGASLEQVDQRIGRPALTRRGIELASLISRHVCF